MTLYDRDARDRHRSSSSSNDYRHKSRSRSRSKSTSRHNRTKDSEEKSNNNNNISLAEIPAKEEELKNAKVREIWIGNLPNNTTEHALYNAFFIHGEIAKIDIHSDRVNYKSNIQNFAFIKYRTVAAASDAYKKGKNSILGGNQLKVSFSDASKRKDIIDDEPGYVLSEKTCKLIYLQLSKTCQIANESIIKDVFKAYGNVKAIQVKSSPIPIAYVEFSKAEEAESAISGLYLNDTTGEKRKVLGDPTCEIGYYFKKKMKIENNMQQGNMHMNNMNKMMMPMNMMINPNMQQQMPNMMQNPAMSKIINI